MKKPWERRLKDLSHLLEGCAKTYFSPELFRLNLNQFLQTARTITFIIQKNKSDIKGYDEWYPKNVIEKWNGDHIMTWAKNSRNTIEKEGDLEMYSEAKATLIFSYLETQDIEIKSSQSLLKLGTSELVKIAHKKFPSYITDDAVIKSERRWVANTLKDYELLYALTVIYSRMYECCRSLGFLIGEPISETIKTPTHYDSHNDEIRRVTYLKLKDLSKNKMTFEIVDFDENAIPNAIKEKAILMKPSNHINSTKELIGFSSKIAEMTFLEYGFHVQTLMLFDEGYQVIDLINTNFEDQADKYIFWRYVADRAHMYKAYGFIWISELWLRNANSGYNKSIQSMPIIGEQLQIVGVDRENYQRIISWDIVRAGENDMPTLGTRKEQEWSNGKAYFMRSILQAIGADADMLND